MKLLKEATRVEDDLTLYRVEGAPIEIGTNWPYHKGTCTLTVRVRFAFPQDLKQLFFTTARALKELFEGRQVDKAQVSLGLVDTPEEMPPLFFPGWVVAFWFRPTEGLELPLLGLRFHYDEKVLDKLKHWLMEAKARFGGWKGVGPFGGVAGWAADPWKLWHVAHPEVQPRVLGFLQGLGLKIFWNDRDGYPPAPPIVEEG